jgi:hypothetical protein
MLFYVIENHSLPTWANLKDPDPQQLEKPTRISAFNQYGTGTGTLDAVTDAYWHHYKYDIRTRTISARLKMT